jgi:hydroxymethylbilane synthase
MSNPGTLIIGSRGSDLALWQTRWVAARLGVPTDVKIITTQGDKVLDRDLSGMAGKGFFTKELEEELYAKSIDLAVHSLKDLPTTTPPGLSIAAVCERAPVADILLVHPDWHDPSRPFPVKAGGKVGASSLRRQSYVKAASDTVEAASLRGNVPTRVRKCKEGQYAAIVLAEAGLSRLNLDVKPLHIYRLNPTQWLPAPGQGALGIETRANDRAESVVAVLNHAKTREACDIERGLLARFEGGCHLPLGTYATATKDGFFFRACFAPQPDRLVRCEVTAPTVEAAVEAAYEKLNALDQQGARHGFEGGGLCEPLAGWF